MQIFPHFLLRENGNDWYIKFLYSDKEEDREDTDMLWA